MNRTTQEAFLNPLIADAAFVHKETLSLDYVPLVITPPWSSVLCAFLSSNVEPLSSLANVGTRARQYILITSCEDTKSRIDHTTDTNYEPRKRNGTILRHQNALVLLAPLLKLNLHRHQQFHPQPLPHLPDLHHSHPFPPATRSPNPPLSPSIGLPTRHPSDSQSSCPDVQVPHRPLRCLGCEGESR